MVTWKASVANALCVSRIPLGAAFLLTYSATNIAAFVGAMGIALLAFLTDVLDGRLARRWGLASDAGALLDGLGDKAFYIAVYLVIGEHHAVASLLIWVLIFREVALYGLRVIDSRREATTKELRWISLLFALLIRVYFLDFFCKDALRAFHVAEPSVMKLGYLLAYGAAMVGVYGLIRMVRNLPDEL